MAQQHDDTISMLSRTVARANRFLASRMQQMGLEGLVPSHGDILAQLFSCDGLSMRELAQRINRDPSTVTTLVKKLAAEGYVTTERSPHDKRATVVLLTTEGRALEAEFRQISHDMNAVQNTGVSAEELAALRATLAKIQRNFDESFEKGM